MSVAPARPREPTALDLWNRVRPKADLIAIGLFMVSLLFFPKGIPGGADAALLFFELIHHTQFVLLTDMACGGGCFQHLPNDTSYLQAHPAVFLQDLDKYGFHAWVVANFWLSLVLSFLIAPLLSWLIY